MTDLSNDERVRRYAEAAHDAVCGCSRRTCGSMSADWRAAADAVIEIANAEQQRLSGKFEDMRQSRRRAMDRASAAEAATDRVEALSAHLEASPLGGPEGRARWAMGQKIRAALEGWA